MFDFNWSRSFGGALALEGNAIISNCSFTSNIASSSGGAGHFTAESGHSVLVSDSDFANNRAGSFGGSLYAGENVEVSLTHCVVHNSTSAADGGAWKRS